MANEPKEVPSTSEEAFPPTSEVSKPCKEGGKHRKTRKLSSSESTSSGSDEVGAGCTTSKSTRKKGQKSSKENEEKVEEEDVEERDGPLEGLKEMVCSKFRVIVSQNRRRIKTDGFDLDLTYITDRIIAMGYPANATEALYRNSMKNITRFLEKRHRDRYKVFNLTLYQSRHFRRGQYSYDPANFKNRVISFEMTDHHPPRLELMAPFCREVHEWLSEHPENVVAVHCKAGKGRTGVMICAYLSYCQFYPSPRQNMDYYSVVRTRNNKGVTIPSQRRYVYYYDHLRKKKLNYLPLRVQLVGCYLERPPRSARGPLMKEQLSLRVSNNDVPVFYGDPMPISDETWIEEEAAWSGCAVSQGPDSYDPNDPQDGCDVVSRRAFGWTVDPDKPVFLEGDVRIDLLLNKKFSIFSTTGSSKLGHIWFNTMFACPGASGGVAYVHGDEAYPYPEGETTIAERKNKFLIGDDESGTGAGNPMSDDTFEEGSGAEKKQSTTSSVLLETRKSSSMTPLSLATAQGQSKSSPLLSPDRTTPSTSIGAQSTPAIGKDSGNSPPTSAATQLSKGKKDGARKSVSKFSKAGRAAKKFFSTSDSTKSRASEPSIHVSASGASTSTPRRSNPEAVSHSPLNFEELQIAQPPGLDKHCSDESLERIYRQKKRTPPRIAISKMLVEAHEKDIVQDNYNERRKSVPSQGEPVKCGVDGRPNQSGPNRLVRNSDEHVNIYPVMEIDRACKNPSINNGFKLIVITKCIEPKMARCADAFLDVTYEKQKEKNDAVFAKSQRNKPYVDLDPKLAEFGAGKTWPPVIQYGNAGMQGNGGESTTLSDSVYRDDPRARDDRTCRYFYKQRTESMSKYPAAGLICPLTGQHCPEPGYGSLRSERANTVVSRGSKVETKQEIERAQEKAEVEVATETKSENPVEADEANEVNVDVRSWHPQRPDNWEHSASSRSSSSSEDGNELAPNSSMVTEEFSGIDSSINEAASPIDETDKKAENLEKARENNRT